MGNEFSYPWDKDGGGDTPYAFSFENLRLRAMYPLDGRLSGSGSGANRPLECVEDSPVSMNVRVNIGMFYLDGSIYSNADSVTELTHDQELSGNDRKDLIVVQKIDANEKIRLVILKGTPSGSPVIPTVTQTSGTKWEVAIAEIYVTDGASSLSNSNITNIVEWAYPVGTYAGQISYMLDVSGLPEYQLPLDSDTFDVRTYPRLYTWTNDQYQTGGEGATEDRLPDFRGKTILGYNDTDLPNGKDTTLATRVQGDQSGNEDVTPVEANMFAHGHAEQYYTDLGSGSQPRRVTDANVVGSFTSSSRGSSTVLDIMNPFGVAVPVINT